MKADNIFGFWDWVGGRYSVCSAVGVYPLSLHYGFDQVRLWCRNNSLTVAVKLRDTVGHDMNIWRYVRHEVETCTTFCHSAVCEMLLKASQRTFSHC